MDECVQSFSAIDMRSMDKGYLQSRFYEAPQGLAVKQINGPPCVCTVYVHV